MSASTAPLGAPYQSWSVNANKVREGQVERYHKAGADEADTLDAVCHGDKLLVEVVGGENSVVIGESIGRIGIERDRRGYMV